MSNANIQVNKIISKIDSVKKLVDEPTGLSDLAFNSYGKNLDQNIDNKVNLVISDIKNSSSKTKSPSIPIFKDMLDIADSFLSEPKVNIDNKDKKIIKYTKESAIVTIHGSKEIIKQELGTLLTGSISDICSGNATVSSGTTYELSPKEFDFMNVLKVNPTSLSGKIMYESPSLNNGKLKFNTELFNTFDTTSYDFTSISGKDLFNITWDNNQQIFNVKTNDELLELSDFFDEYYESIDFPDIEYIIKTTMLLVLQGGDDDPKDFTDGLNYLEKIIKKILSYCNILNTGQKPLKNNPTDTFNEDDEDIEKFFDFNNNEGIDIDDENSRYKRVLKFRDCDNIESPVNSNHIDDFVYLNELDEESILNTMKKVSNDVSDGDNNMFYLSLLNSFILKVPTALMSAVLSPKMLFPIIFSYKVIQNTPFVDVEKDIKILMGKLNKIFYNIISKLFKIFILNFWNLLKKDLLKFITSVATTILENKIKRYKTIVLSLIALLTKLLSMEINNCVDLFNMIGLTIDAAFSAPTKIPLPGILLSLSDLLPGYSADRAYMNCVEKLQNSGIETGPLYGEPNKLLSMIKSIFDAHTEETDSNGYVSVSNKEIILPFGVIPPGVLSSSGKIF